MAGALELVLARFPIWRATQVRAASVDHEHAIGRAVHPDAVALLELGVDAKRKLGWIANLENRIRLEKSAGEKESEKRDEPGHQEASDHGPHKTAPTLVDFRI
jgi:hypothetical protein